MRNIWIWVVVAIIVIGGGVWYWQSTQVPAMTMSDDGTPAAVDAVDDASSGTQTTDSTGVTVTTGTTVTTAPMSATITYNGDAFSPSSVTIAKGGTVKFVSTASDMWVASNPHPVHTGYDGTSMQQHCAANYAGAAPFDQCAVGSNFTFTFTKSGTWGYHNHMNPGLGGTVIVQ